MPIVGAELAVPTPAQSLIEETRRHLLSGQEEELNRLTNPIQPTDLNIALQYGLNGIGKGTILSVDLEEIRVWETDGQQTLTLVERGVNGSDPAAHDPLATVRVRPKFSDYRIFRALNEDIADMGSPLNGLYAVTVVEVKYNPAVKGYDLAEAGDVIRILDVRYKTPGPDKDWKSLRYWRLDRNANRSDFPSGNALVAQSRAYAGMPVRVWCATPFRPLDGHTGDIGSITGLASSMFDIPPMGAACRLVIPREFKRNFTEAQVEPRRSEEVGAGAVANSVVGLQKLRQSRITAEAARLASDFPVTFR